jgi:signal transduction histidine kinase
MLPLLAVLVAIMGYFYGIWMPKLSADAKAGYVREVEHHLDSVGAGLVPLLLGRQLDVIYENLDALMKANPEWKQIVLVDPEGKDLYPLGGRPNIRNQTDLQLIELQKPVFLNDTRLATLHVTVDQGPSIAKQRKHFFEIGIVFAAMALLLLVTMFLLFETMVIKPVHNLSRATKALARRDFDIPLPAVTKDEIGSLIETFSIMRESRRKAEENLARSNKELEQFAYVVSHDLREPLRMVGSYVTLLERRYAKQLDKDAFEFITFAKEGAKRMDQMIVDLLEYSRAGRKSGEQSQLTILPVLDEALHALSLRVKETSATIEVSEAIKDLPQLPGFHDELVRLFLNLIGNAIKYHPQDRAPVVVIDGRRENDRVIISVKDNGIGIDPQFFERIFQVFQRLHTRAEYEGSGVGLATCKKIVEHHAGRIWVESTPGQGATFFVSLPLSGPEPAALS